MDLNGDGIQDMISGSYTPGDLYLFPGTKDGSFKVGETLQGKDGKNLHAGSASAVFAADWDQDGDLDLIVGNIKGEVSWIPNESGNKTMAFGIPLPIEADGQPILVAKDAGPCVADWDGDGHLDLLVGDDEGKVSFFRNTAISGLPQLTAGLILVPKGAYPAQGQWGPKDDGSITKESRGIRSKVSVADWDEDGRLDLLLGDFISIKSEGSKLPEAQRVERDAVMAALEKINKERAVFREDALKKFRQQHGIQEMEELSREQLLNFAQTYEKLVEKDETQRRLKTERQVQIEIFSKYWETVNVKGDAHGHVWVFLRKATGAAVMESSGQRSEE